MVLQAQSPLVETISIEQGLSQGFVPAICQDEDGFLWFGTKNGLNRYDGYQFQVFKNDPFDSLSLNDNEIIDVKAAGDFLALFTNSSRIQLFHRKTQRFYTIPPFAGSIFLHKFFSTGKNSLGLLFEEAEKTALYLIHWPSDLVERVENGETLSDLLQIEILFRHPKLLDAAVSLDQKKIRMLSQNSILEYDIQSGSVLEINTPFLFEMSRQEINSKRIAEDSSGAIWVFQNTKLARFNGQKWEVYTFPFPNTYLMATDAQGSFFWFLTGNSTLYGVDMNKMPVNLQPTWELPLDYLITSCFTDQFGNIWIGTDAHGIRKFSPRTGAFKNYVNGMSIYCQPVYNGKNHVFMGDARRKISFLKLLNLRSGQVEHTEGMGVSERDAAFGGITENGRFWFVIKKKSAQLTCLDPETGLLESIPLPDGGIPKVSVMRFALPDEIWIFASANTIRFNITTRKFSVFDNPQLSDAQIIAAERSPDGTWWIGTTNGLHKAKIGNTGQLIFSTIRVEKNNRNSLLTNSIKSLLVDPDDPNLLWIGTNGHGMSRLEISQNQFTHYTTKNGLPDDVVYGILADDEKPHNLWLSTNRGLTRFSPKTGLFQYYFKSDGLQDNEFNTFASYKSASGTLFFGGVNGLTVFDPKNLSAHGKPPRIHFTGLKINGMDVGPRDPNPIIKKDIAFLERLELSFSQNSIVLQFAATDYTAPQRNQFAYYLEGAEPEWAHRGFEHSAQYLNLAPGTYTFRAKAANSSGVWNEQPIALVIVIHAPWYRTWWAYLGYAGFFALAIFLFYKNHLRRRLEHAEAERLKGLDEFKSRFFTNITHEFRTPLTVILGTSEQVQTKADDELKGKMKLIRRNGENLLRLINQILDLAKLESNTLKINYVQGDMLAYLRYIAESLHSLANAQNVMLRVESDQAKIVMDYDPERLLQIVHNLLSNAIKFTPSGGKVILRLTVDGGREPRSVHRLPSAVITVTDTGAGIPAANLPHIFDRFYQAENLEKAKAGGTGIGLALTRELVKAMGGNISVESEVGKGTTFTVRLPITKKAELGLPPASSEGGGDSPLPTSPERVGVRSLPSSEEAGGRLILLIEDNPDVVEYLSACLSSPFGEPAPIIRGGREGAYQLDFAYNGQAGIEKALEIVPDLIISDVMMPEKDGFEVVETLKNDERTSHIPIILLSAKATVANRIEGLKRGADAYLVKPFHQEELLTMLHNLLELRRKLQAKYAELVASEPVLEAGAPADPEDAFLMKVRAAVEQNFSDSDFDMPHLARALAMSRSQIFRKMKALTGQAPSLFIRSVRLRHGRHLLETTQLTISEIAYEVGFSSGKYFSDAYLDEFGERPSQHGG